MPCGQRGGKRAGQPRQRASIIASTAIRGLTFASIAVAAGQHRLQPAQRALRRPLLRAGAGQRGGVGVHRGDRRAAARMVSTSR